MRGQMQRLGAHTVVREGAGSGRLATFEASHDDGREMRLRVVADVTLDGEDATRFEEEVQRLSRLRHPGVEPPIDWGAAPLFVATARTRSVSLRALSDESPDGRLSGDVAAWIGGEVAAGLIAAHGVGAVHAGLSLDSVRIDGQGRARVTDFGLMRWLHGDAADGAGLEIMECMAPEQLTDPGRVGPATDVFGLGLLLYRCVTGASPFEASSPLGMSIRLTMGRQTPLRDHGVTLEGELESLLTAMLALKPEYRPTMAQAQEVLRKHASGAPELVGELLERRSAPSVSGVLRVDVPDEAPEEASEEARHAEAERASSRPPTGVALSTVDGRPVEPAPALVLTPPDAGALDPGRGSIPPRVARLAEEPRPSQRPPPPYVIDDDPTALSVTLPPELQLEAWRTPGRGYDTAEWLYGDDLGEDLDARGEPAARFPRTMLIETPERRGRRSEGGTAMLPVRPVAAPAPRTSVPSPSLPPSVLSFDAPRRPGSESPRVAAASPVGSGAPSWAIWTAVALGAFSLVVGAASFAMLLAVG